MKKILLLAAFLVGSASATFAADHRVTVADFQFTPKTVNAVVGDTITWVWRGPATHTTTSVTIPAGAAAWNTQLDATNTRFRYSLTVPGVYHYQCNFHFSIGMKGTIRVSATPRAETPATR